MKLLSTLLALSCALALHAQDCPFDPTVVGNENICPNDSLTLTTQQYDSYQWYTRPFSGSLPLEPVPGATGPTFTVDYQEVPLYVAVQATLNGCTERSAEVLVDGWAFLPVFVISEGEFEIGPNGEHIICEGDTALFTLGLPYTTNIQWYDAGEPIPGATNVKLEVTQPGQYTVSAAPAVCPDFIQYLGVTLDVVWGTGPNCAPTAVYDPSVVLPATIAPNPAHTEFRIAVDDPERVELVLLDARGSLVFTQYFTRTARIDVADLPRGTYFVWLSSVKGTYVQKLMVSQ
jgi:hypothetical protein